MRRHGLPTAPERKRTTTWADFIRTHVALLAGTDFFTAEVLTLRGRHRDGKRVASLVRSNGDSDENYWDEENAPASKQIGCHARQGFDKKTCSLPNAWKVPLHLDFRLHGLCQSGSGKAIQLYKAIIRTPSI